MLFATLNSQSLVVELKDADWFVSLCICTDHQLPLKKGSEIGRVDKTPLVLMNLINGMLNFRIGYH